MHTLEAGAESPKSQRLQVMLSIRQEMDCETTSISKMTVSAPESRRANTELGKVLHQKEKLVQLQHTHITYITRYPNNPNTNNPNTKTCQDIPECKDVGFQRGVVS